MKKEELIAKAAERGITLSEEQAEKYINLSDEELENIAGGGDDSWCPKEKPFNIYDELVKVACNCSSYLSSGKVNIRTCTNCQHFVSVTEVEGGAYELACYGNQPNR
jgi:hypothetical protein